MPRLRRRWGTVRCLSREGQPAIELIERQCDVEARDEEIARDVRARGPVVAGDTLKQGCSDRILLQ